MKSLMQAMRSPTAFAAVLFLPFGIVASAASTATPGKEEFGLSARELVQATEKVEAEIAQCMRAQGFEYIAADYETVRKGMTSDKNIPGVSEVDFIGKYGFGISTFYTGKPPQLETGYSPVRVGLGDRNVAIYKRLPPPDQVAYNRALFGQNTDASFATSLEREDFSRTGGCTRKGVEKAFTPEQLSSSYYNPRDALVNKDPRMKEALRKYAAEMRRSGFDYNHPDEVSPDLYKRLNTLTQDQTIPMDKMTADQLKALKDLQAYERRLAKKSHQLTEDIFEPVEERITKEMHSRSAK